MCRGLVVFAGQHTKLVKFYAQTISLCAGYWATAPENGPEGWRARWNDFLFAE
jgi:hypothetical protein